MRIVLGIGLAWLTASAMAQEAFRFEGRAGSSRIVVAQEGDALVLSLQGREVHRWPAAGAPEASAREVRVGNRTLGIVEIASPPRRYVAVVDGRALRFAGRSDPHGDPGERRRDVVQVADRTGDGVDDVVVGQVYEGRHICGEAETLLDPRAIHPRTGQLVSVTLRRVAEGAPEVAASAEALVERAPLVRLQPTSTSSAAGHDVATAPPAGALVDGEAATAWIEASPGDGTWEFATFRWPAPDAPIQAVAITTPAIEGASSPRSVYLVFDSTRVHVALPEGEGPWWVRLPEPARTRCVSVVLEGARRGTHAALGEIAAYADLDFGEGLEALVGRLAGGGTAASEAAELLASIGEPVLPLLDARWSEMPSAEKRLALGIFARHASTELGRSGLLRGALDSDADVRTAAVDRAIAAEAVDALEPMIAIAGEPGDRAALAIARRAPARSDALLDALGRDGGPDRPALREALRTAMQRGGNREGLATWAQTASAGSLASAAFALAGGGETLDPLAQSLLVRAVGFASDFEDRWRAIHAARVLSPDLEGAATIDAFLRAQASADEWMTRAAAIESLASRRIEDAGAIARAALADDYPRVRMAALRAFRVLGSGPLREIGLAARQDPWPMVRAAGLVALGRSARVRPVVRAAVGDPAQLVRAAAIALLDPDDAQDWALIAGVLQDDDEWPKVIRAGLAAAVERCRPDAIDALAAVADRGLRPNPWAPDVELGAEAIEVAARIGGPAARALLERAASPVAPAPYRNAAERAGDAESCRAE